MPDITVNGDPVPQTAGNTLVRSEDIPGGHAACDAEITRLRALVAEILGEFGGPIDITGTHVAYTSGPRLAGWCQRAGMEVTP